MVFDRSVISLGAIVLALLGYILIHSETNRMLDSSLQVFIVCNMVLIICFVALIIRRRRTVIALVFHRKQVVGGVLAAVTLMTVFFYTLVRLRA